MDAKKQVLIIKTCFCYFLYSSRMLLSTHSIATPESANTASHIDASPSRPSTITSIFTASAKITFCQAIRLVLRAIRMASGIACA